MAKKTLLYRAAFDISQVYMSEGNALCLTADHPEDFPVLDIHGRHQALQLGRKRDVGVGIHVPQDCGGLKVHPECGCGRHVHCFGHWLVMLFGSHEV
jgi:hypothetical protein